MKAWWNLTIEEQVVRSRNCGIGSIIIAVIFVVIAFLSIKSNNDIIDRCVATTTGEVTSVQGSTRRHFESYLRARFVVDGLTYYAYGRYSTGYSSFDTFSKKPVTVHYDPSDPKIAYAADGPETWLISMWFIVAIIFGIGSPFFFLQAKKIDDKLKQTIK